ncbi:MAG: DUF547 domain-containing protein [Flammeovirgaceae bacterium]
MDDFLGKYVEEGGVKYKEIKKNPTELKSLVEMIANIKLESKATNEIKAFYINSYNILVIKGIIDAYPVGSPLDVLGFFDKKIYKVAGEDITLNHLEHEIIRKKYADARIHFVLVCAANGCPQIADFAYFPATLDQLLDLQAKKAINNPQFVKIGAKDKKVLLSEIFKWYKDDFTRESKTLLNYLNKYLNNPLSEEFTMDFYTYDWKLNER